MEVREKEEERSRDKEISNRCEVGKDVGSVELDSTRVSWRR